MVDTPVHGEDLAGFAQENMDLLLRALADRYAHHINRWGARYVSVFRNWGREAGASLSHSHWQIIALPMVPPLLRREMDVLSQAPFCHLCNVAWREAASSRLIAESGRWIAISPFCSKTPYEVWMLPKEHISSLAELRDESRLELASLLRLVLGSLRSVLGDPPYNIMIYQLPSGYHLNLRIQPAISRIAGFEHSTGVYINQTPPERAASELRRAGSPKG